jgi:hypothetical protein
MNDVNRMTLDNSAGVLMTTFVSQQVSTPAVSTGRVLRALSSVREWGKDYAGAFRAASAAPRRTGMDPVALMLFGRD